MLRNSNNEKVLDDALREAAEVAGDRWVLLTLGALVDGSRRFGDLLNDLGGIAPNVLIDRLRRMERSGLVVATLYSHRPRRYVYDLTEAGRELAAILPSLAAWAGRRGGGEPRRHTVCGTPLETADLVPRLRSARRRRRARRQPPVGLMPIRVPQVVGRAMTGRDPGEEHRTSTPLELLFDLCFVVAVAQAASVLHHELAAGHVHHGVQGYLMVFFAIWWAWMNFTWFASAYDTDDVPYRMFTFLQIAGVLVLASGVAKAFNGDFTIITVGYVIMRISMTAQWLRAARADRRRPSTARRYAFAIVVTQIGWVLRLALPDSWGFTLFFVLVALELIAPIWAEHTGRPTTWHPAHICERYGLFTIIVLGECILSAFLAIDASITDHGTSVELVVIAVAGLTAVFAIWWTYFQLSAEEMLETQSNVAFLWGYAHYGLFASIAALGAGIAVAADSLVPSDEQAVHVELSATGRALAVGIPIAVILVLLALLRSLASVGRPRVL